ncbi:MAG: hypothetical protein H6606_08055 [Flavobacteriales bacterium]|nr:hypothetical protein [Flavobacteriales bacterium]
MNNLPEHKCVRVKGIDGSIRYECWHFNPVTYGILPENSLTFGFDFPDYSPSMIHHLGIEKALNDANYQLFSSNLLANEWGEECLVDTFVTTSYDSIKYRITFYDSIGSSLGQIIWKD